MATDDQNAEFYAGDDVILQVTVTDESGAAQSLSGAAVSWKLARKAGGTAVLTKTTSSGITITDAAGGVLQISLSDTDTSALFGGYWHQVVVTDSSSNDTTVTTGNIFVKRRT